MRFRVLGPLEVETDSGPVVLRGQKERLLLALLLTRPNQVVAVEALIGGLWGEHPPGSAPKTLQSHVVRLRHALELPIERTEGLEHGNRTGYNVNVHEIKPGIDLAISAISSASA